MNYDYNKDEIKNSLTIEQIKECLGEWDADPIEKNNVLISKTICHNSCGCGSHKLYYYSNTGLFKCYTDCGGEAFDIFELTRKVMSREHPKPREDSDWNLPEAIDYVARKFGFAPNIKLDENEISIGKDLTVIQNYDRIKDIDIKTQQVELKEYDDTFLKHLPHNVRIQPWIDEGITQEVMNHAGICYDPKNAGIVIPHYDINNRLIGIRERTLIQENAELYGKYLPARIGGTMFNHPLSFNLYNLNKSKDNIKRMGKAIVFEGEKSPLKYKSYFGEENDITVAICGSSFINYQAWLLIQSGAKEIIIALDRQFKEIGDDEFKKLVKNLKAIHKKYGSFVNISFMFDKGKVLDYKSSPIDHGPKIFCDLFKERVNLY
jgi:hypothetical protein